MYPNDDAEMVELFVNDKQSLWDASDAARMAEISAKALTNYRQRNQLGFDVEKTQGRYLFTNNQVLRLACMTELAWALGPDMATKIIGTAWEHLFDGNLDPKVEVETLTGLKIFVYRPSEDFDEAVPPFFRDHGAVHREPLIDRVHDVTNNNLEFVIGELAPPRTALVANIGWAITEVARAAVEQVKDDMRFFDTLTKENAMPKMRKTITEAFYMHRGLSEPIKMAREKLASS